MTEPTFQAVRLWPYGDRKPRREPYSEEPVARSLARVIYTALFERSHSLVEFRSQPREHHQEYLLRADLPTSAAPEAPENSIAPEIKTLGESAVQQLPPRVGVELARVNIDPIGTAAAPTERLVTTRTDLTSWKDGSVGSSPSPITALIEAFAEHRRPHTIQVVARRLSAGEVAVSVRCVDFAAEARCHTRDQDARYRQHAPPPTLNSVFTEQGFTTNRTLPAEHWWQSRTEARLPGDQQPVRELTFGVDRSTKQATVAEELATTPEEFQCVIDDSIPGPRLVDRYSQLGVDPWPALTAEQLPTFCGLSPVTYLTSPWTNSRGRTHLQLEVLSVLRDPFGDVATPSDGHLTTTAVSGRVKAFCREIATDHSKLLKQATQWLLEQGDRLSHRPTEFPPGTFTRSKPDGTTDLVIVSSGETLARGTAINAATYADRADDIDGVTIMMATSKGGRTAAKTLLQQFTTHSPQGHAQLYEGALSLTDGDWKAIRPKQTPPYEWTLTPTGTLRCSLDGVVMTELARDQPAESALESLPRARQSETGLEIVTPTADPIQDSSARAEDPSDWEIVRQPALPTQLTTGLEQATVLAESAGQFTEPRLSASWDQFHRVRRESEAAATFFDRYTVAEPDAELAVDAVVPNFVAWLRHQTDELVSSGLHQPLSSGYTSVYDRSLERGADRFPDCTWLYPPSSNIGKVM